MTAEPTVDAATNGPDGMTVGGAVVPLRGDRPARYVDAVEAYLTAAGINTSSRRIYRISLSTWAWLARGEQPTAASAVRPHAHGEPPTTR
jgi:hypothetical protein